jgi:16S rRNA C967 or C1407 C5-methylase (RsmB/RsmF family)/NOL1/NOP2/fmu family ribosome biogenesis protein
LQVPQALIQSIQSVVGFDSVAFEQVHASGDQVVSIRLNPSKSVISPSLNLEAKVPWCEHGYYLKERPFFTFDPLLHAGAYYVQEASSMFVWQALQQLMPDQEGKKVLDLCAAPGGKSTLLASHFKDGLVVSNEVIKNRATILVENMSKWGTAASVVTNNDPLHFQSLPGYFDLILADAPCSGSGLFRKDPDAIEHWSEDNVVLCSQRQQRILADILPALKENGILLYSTCSYSEAENEVISDWLVAEMGMRSMSLELAAEWGIVETSSTSCAAKGYRFYPNLLKGEGFFLAAFQKKETVGFKKQKPNQITGLSKNELEQLKASLPLIEGLAYFQQSGAIRAIPEQWMAEIGLLASHLYIKKAGIEIGSLKGRDLVPAHELALSSLLQAGFSVLDIDLEQALLYLKRKDLVLNGQNGWNLLQYCGLSLGWVKVLPNRINNYYPAQWRILKD